MSQNNIESISEQISSDQERSIIDNDDINNWTEEDAKDYLKMVEGKITFLQNYLEEIKKKDDYRKELEEELKRWEKKREKAQKFIESYSDKLL